MANVQDHPTIPNPQMCAGIFAAAGDWLRPPDGSELARLPEGKRRAAVALGLMIFAEQFADALRHSEARDG